MNEYKKPETDSDTENKLVVTSGETGWRRGKTGEGDLEIQTTKYKINKIQGCYVQHREYNQYFIITLNGV